MATTCTTTPPGDAVVGVPRPDPLAGYTTAHLAAHERARQRRELARDREKLEYEREDAEKATLDEDMRVLQVRYRRLVERREPVGDVVRAMAAVAKVRAPLQTRITERREREATAGKWAETFIGLLNAQVSRMRAKVDPFSNSATVSTPMRMRPVARLREMRGTRRIRSAAKSRSGDSSDGESSDEPPRGVVGRHSADVDPPPDHYFPGAGRIFGAIGFIPAPSWVKLRAFHLLPERVQRRAWDQLGECVARRRRLEVAEAGRGAVES